MSIFDGVGLLASYIYAFGLLFIVEATGKRFHWPQFFTRKLVHIGAGLWVWGAVLLFDHWYWGILPFATFIVLNYIFYRKQTFEQMDSSESSPGTVYFAVSITILLALFWRTEGPVDRLPVAVAAIMAMTIGDAFAALFGRYLGTRHFTVWQNNKTVLGTVAMFGSSVLVIFATLFFLPASFLSPFSKAFSLNTVILVSIASAVVAIVAEAVSPSGTDNLSVPLLTALVLFLIAS